MRRLILISAAVLVWASGRPAGGQGRAPVPVEWRVSGSPAGPVVARAAFRVAVEAHIASGWHLYAMDEPDGGPVPTEFTTAADGPVDLLSVGAGPPLRQGQPGTAEAASFYVGQATFRLKLRVRKNASVGGQELPVTVRYQACNARMCLPPHSVRLLVPVTVHAGRLR